MPDVANLQSNMYGMDTFTSGWRIQLKVDDEMIFVAPRQLQQQFCEVPWEAPYFVSFPLCGIQLLVGGPKGVKAAGLLVQLLLRRQ